MISTSQPSIAKYLFFLSICLSGRIFAAPVPQQTANQAACGWLKHHPAPLEASLSRDARRAEAGTDIDGRVLYYVVPLTPQGFVVLSADDEIEPVIVFSATGRYDSSEDSPLSAMLERDMKDRLEWVSRILTDENLTAVRAARVNSDASGKWQVLVEAEAEMQADEKGDVRAAGQTTVSDVRVAPLLQSTWGQDDAAGGYCYNYYTPNHYPTGCVATVMAQLMRYHTWPMTGIGVQSFAITVDDVEQYWTTRGGNGSGGAYNWSQMPYDPATGLTTAQRQAIGALCYDAGLSVGMSYTASSSGASTHTANQALKDTFGYTNSVFGYGFSSAGDAGLWGMMNANLDAALPIILAISGYDVGHAVVADGYGYINGTMYHHLNMGWGGLDDAWYQLPLIEAGYIFNVITDCVYNIYPTGTGEIVSGRITSMAGAPLEGVSVTAYQGASVVKQAVTNNRGIYALKNLPSNRTYRLSAVKSGYVFVDQTISTGFSQDWNSTSGNKWGIHFSSTTASPPTAMDQLVDANSLSDKCITLEALDDHLPNPPARMTFVITSLPSHGTLSEPDVGPIHSVPYVMATDANSVCYTPCPYFGGQDGFTFKANDGGTSPSGGDSNVATVTVNVDNTITSEFGTDGTTGTNTMVNTTYYASRSQALYLKSDIGAARYLTDLAIQFTHLPPIPFKKWAIRMQHTNKSQYTDVVADFLTTGWTKVYQADVTISQTGWYNFHFSTPFSYNGTQNLLIDFTFDNTSVSGSTGNYLFYNVGGSYDIDRVITVVTDQAVHSSPLTWDFWAGNGYYWGGDWLPSIKFVGTIPLDPMPGDFDATCDVKLPDLALLSAAWNTQQGQASYDPGCDISTPKDNKVNLFDLLVFADHWMQPYQP